MSATLATITPVNKRLYSATTGAVTALGIDNRGEYSTRVNLGGALLDIIPPGTSRTYPLGNVTNYGGWVLLCPVRSQATISELARLGTQIVLTTYGSNDAIPYGSATQPGELAASADDLAGVDTFLSALWRRHFEVRTFGAQVDNVSDDTAPVQACLDGANVTGGGQILFPAGTCITQTLTDYSNVHLRGAGIGATTLRLKAGTNGDLINGGSVNVALINVNDQTAGDGSTAGLANWSLTGLTLDGNKANQSGGPSYCLRVYGYTYILRDCQFINGFSGGLQLDWNGGNTPAGAVGMEAQLDTIKVRGCGGIGLEFGGPHDSQWNNVFIENSASHGVHLGPHASGTMVSNLHSWGSGLGVNAVAILCEATSQWANCVAEGSDVAQLVLLANGVSWVGGDIYTANGGAGIQFGQNAGGTPYPGSSYQSGGLTTQRSVQYCNIDTQFTSIASINGALWFVRDNGGNNVRATVGAGVTTVFTGALSTSTQLAFANFGGSGLNASTLQLPGQLVLFRSSSQVTATGGTINTQGFTVARVTPAAAITGVILQAGLYDNQYVIVQNQSAFSISFAAAATSNVADEAGGTSPIIANTARAFVWSSATSRWYRLA